VSLPRPDGRVEPFALARTGNAAKKNPGSRPGLEAVSLRRRRKIQ
jgi:hypothetical protein